MSRKPRQDSTFPPLTLEEHTSSVTMAEANAGMDEADPFEALLKPPIDTHHIALSNDQHSSGVRSPRTKAAKGGLTPIEGALPEFESDRATQPATKRADGPKQTRLPSWARWAYFPAAALAVAWIGTLAAFTDSFHNRWGEFEYRPFPVIIITALALLPATFILLGAYVLRQAARLSVETRRARAIADDLAIPAALAVDQAGGAADAVRREVARATVAGEAAERQLLSLRQALADESERLIAATKAAEKTARSLTESLSRERTEMANLSAGLGQQVGAVSEAIGQQTKLMTDTSSTAVLQLKEAEAAIAARTTGLAAAASEAGEAAELAGEALARQAERLEAAGELVGVKLQALNESLGRGHSRLADLAVQLQTDQEALASRLEAQRITALAATTEAQSGTAQVAEGAEAVASSLRGLIAEADQQLRSVGETLQTEQAALDARARASLSLFQDAMAQERAAIETETQTALTNLTAAGEEARRAAGKAVEDAIQTSLDQLAIKAEETRRTAVADIKAASAAAAGQAEAARARVEQLGEAAFAAGQKADQAFEARINSARRQIEQAAALVEKAGASAVGRVDAGLVSARTTLTQLEALLTAVDARMAAAPNQARAHAEMVKATVEAGLKEISATARKLGADAEAVDVALQDRVRRNYETLSEALKTMGRVAAVTEETAVRAAILPKALVSQTPVPPAPVPPAPVPPAPDPQAPTLQPPIPKDAVVQTAVAHASVAQASPQPLPPQPEPLKTVPAPARPTPAAEAFAERAIRVPAAVIEPIIAPTQSALEAGLRPRLRLTPETVSSPSPPSPIQERAAPVTHESLEPFLQRHTAARTPLTAAPQPLPSAHPASSRDSGWTWKDLLSSIDEPPIDDEVLAERLIAEIESLGLDSTTLLPHAHMDAIAAHQQRGDAEAVRSAVRGLAPGAVRRLSRRVLTDKVLRAQADRYVRRYEDLLNDSAQRDREGFMTAALLGSEPGRAFLLFDAAVGELH